jgi:hypothetical protein
VPIVFAPLVMTVIPKSVGWGALSPKPGHVPEYIVSNQNEAVVCE